MSSKKTYSVYIHISPSNKRYIGITSKKKVEYRWNNGKGYEHNIYFTNAINKYGWDNFEHIIICRGLDKETAKWLEIELIREWDTTNREKGYNQTKGGDGMNGLSPSEETRKKMSKSRMGENNGMYGVHRYGEDNPFYGRQHTEEAKEKISEANSGENNPNARKVICLTTMKIFNTLDEGADFYNIASGTSISACCKNKKRYKSSGKLEDGTPLVWVYYEDYLKMTEEEIKNKLRDADKRIICITTNMIFDTLKEGADFYNIKSIGNLSECCNGKSKSCGKYNGQKLQWKHLIDYLEEHNNNNNN